MAGTFTWKGQVNLKSLSEGIYLLQIETNMEISNRRIIIKKINIFA